MSTVAQQTSSFTEEAERAAFEAIKVFFNGSAVLGGDDEIREDLALLESGILDSLGILQLVTFLGDEFDVEVSDDDFVAENFETIGSLARFVARKQSSKVG